MKRILVFIIAFALLLGMVGCGSKEPTPTPSQMAFKASKEAYDNINSAYGIVSEFGSDIYEAWRIGIYDQDEDDFGLAYLAKELNLPLEDMKMGVAHLANQEKWDTMTEEEKKSASDSAESTFSLFCILLDNKFDVCIHAVIHTYLVNGKTEEASALLSAAKTQMREMSEKYSDYEHYPALKGYYTTTSSFFDFCQSPAGSFEQIKTTVNDYKNSARDYKSDLDYIFED